MAGFSASIPGSSVAVAPGNPAGLAVQWESLPGWLQMLLACGGLLLSIGLLLWLYSYEARLIRPLTAAGLLALRGAVLAGALTAK